MIQTALRVAVVYLVHLSLAAVVALGLRGFELLWEVLFHEHEPKIAGLFPLRYILEFGDAAVLIVFGIFGTIEAVRAFRRR